MPTYRVQDEAGTTLDLTGDSPPTEKELEEVFSTLPKEAAPMSGLARGLSTGLSALGKGISTVSALTRPTAPIERWLRGDKIAPESLADIPKMAAADPMTKQYVEAEKFWEEQTPLTPAQKRSGWTKAGEMAGGFLPIVATGPLAPATIGAEAFSNHLLNDFESEKKAGKTENEAAAIAMTRGIVSGSLQAAVFEFLPKPLREAGQKLLVDKFGKSWFSKFIAGRVAQTAEGAALGTASQVSENLASSRPLLEGAPSAAAGMAAAQALMPRPMAPALQKPPLEAPGGQEAPPEVAPEAKTTYSLISKPGGWHTIEDAQGNKVFESRNPADAQARLAALQPEGAAPPPPAPTTLPPDEQAMIDAERGNLPVPIQMVDPDAMPAGDNEPFARLKTQMSGKIAIADRANGRILVNPKEFSAWLKDIPKENRQEAVKALFRGEEFAHLHTTDAQALDYYNSLTAAEVGIHKRIHSGDWKGDRTGFRDMTPTAWGHEFAAFRLTQLQRMTPREIAEAVGKEKWTLKSLTALDSVIRGIREHAFVVGGTAASGRGREIASTILDRMQNNLTLAKGLASMPAATRKGGKEPDHTNPFRTDDPTEHFDYSPANLAKYQDLSGRFSALSKTEPGSDKHTEVWKEYEDLRNRYNGNPPKQLLREQEVENIRAAAKQYRASGDEQSAREVEAYAKNLERDASEQAMPAATRKQSVRELTEEEKSKLPPVPSEQRGVPYNLPRAPRQEDMPMEVAKGSGPLFQGKPTRGEYAKAPEDKATPPLIESGYFRPSGSARHPVPEGERTSTSEHGALPAMTGTVLEQKAGQLLDTQLGQFVKDATEGKKASLPSITDIEKSLNRATGGRIQEGAAFDMAQRLINDRLQKAPGETLRLMQQSELDRRARKKEGVPIRRMPPVADAPSEGAPGFQLQPEQAIERTGMAWQREGQRKFKAPEVAAGQAELPGVLGGVKTEDPNIRRERTLATAPESAFQTAARLNEQKLATSEESRVAGHEARQDTALVDARQARRQRVIGYLMDRMTRRPLADLRTSLERTSVKPEDIRYGTAWRNKGEGDISAWQAFSPEAEKSPTVLGMNLVNEAGVSGDVPKTVTRRVTAIMDRKSEKVHLVSTYEERGRGQVRLLDPGSGAAKQHSSLDTMLKRYRVLYSALLDQPVQNFRQDFKDLPDFMDKFGKEADERSTGASEYQEPPAIEGTPGIRGEGADFQGPGRALVTEIDEGAIEQAGRTPMMPEEARALFDLSVSQQKGPALTEGDVLDAIKSLKDKPNRQAISALTKMADGLQESNPDASPDELLNLAAKRILQTHERSKNLDDFTKNMQSQGSRTPDEPLMPAATRKMPKDLGVKAADEAVRVGKMARAAFKRSSTREDMSRGANAVNTESVVLGDKAGGAIRLESATRPKTALGAMLSVAEGNKDILAAANPLIASGAIKTRYQASPEALDKLNKLMEADPRYAEARQRMSATERKWTKETDLLGKEKMVKGGLGAPAGGDVARVGREMMRDIKKKAIKELRESGDITVEGSEKYYDPTSKSELDKFLMMLDNGDRKADSLINSGHWSEGRKGRAWKAGNAKLRAEVEFAKAHWGNPELVNTAMQASVELDKVFDQRVQAGFGTKFREEFLPGRYDGEFVDNDSVSFFGASRGLLGMRSGEPKTFDSYYHAAQAGPYIAATRDIATLVGNSVKQAQRRIHRDAWMDSWKDIKDAATGKPFAKDPVKNKPGSRSPYSSPGADYELMTVSGKTMAVLKGDGARLVRQLTDPNFVTDWAPTRLALETGQWLKHTLLMGDFFHLFRVGYYSASIMGAKTGMTPGWAALHFREADIPRAVEKGVLSDSAAKWLTEKLPTNFGGKLGTMSRIGLSNRFQHEGLNVGQIQDAIYKDLSKNVPLFGGYNRFLFDKWTRGLMMRSALEEYQRKMAVDPKADSQTVMRETAFDLNIYFGSLGKQSWVKSAGWQDVMRIFFLAPQWGEGLLRKELAIPKAIGKAVMEGSPRRLLEGRDTAARGIARGLVSMLVLTQVANLISRRHPTWENKEEGQKWNADVGEGVFISPLSVFNEVSHDLIRLHETKRNNWEVIKQIGSNKLGFWGRVATVLATSRKPTGEAITTTGGVMGAAAGQLIPVPITLGKVMQGIAHPLVPGLVPPVEPGQAYRQALATAGFKGEIAQQPIQQIQRQASRFMQESGLRPQTAITIPTDEPSYSKLRHSIQIGDERGAGRILNELRKTHPEGHIIKVMNQWARRPFTGGYNTENMFLDSLDDNGRKTYDEAQQQKMDLLNKFVDFYIRTQP